MASTDDLLNLLKRHLLASAPAHSVSPELLADTAYRNLDPDEVSPPLVAWACVLELRQMARQLLRRTYDGAQDEAGQGDLFTGLQDRYPGTGEHRGLYVPRAQMTYTDRLFNIARLRREAQAKLAHADALEAETAELRAQGYWAECA
jgi:hypothetical protein